MELRVPPQNIEAEKAVIGSILIDDSSLNKVIDILNKDSFYDLRHGIIFENIVSLFNENKPVDVLTLTAGLKKQNKLKQAGGSAYLGELISQVPTSANIEEYANLVREASVRRQLIGFATKLDESARKEQRKLEEVLDELETNLLSISISNATKDFMDASSLVELHMQRADEYAKNPDALRGVATGIRPLDNILGGLHKSDLIVLAARPSVGKSAFAIDIARHISSHEKKTIAFFSLEMPAIQIFERMLAQQTGINLWTLRMGQIKDDQYAKYNEGVAKLADSKIFIDDTAGINIMQLRSKARKLMLENSLDLIVIDYLQLMQGNSSTDNRAQEIGEISRSLKILARELNIPVIALSQLNRAVENRQDRIPQLSDLRESGSIEQDADLVIFLSRDMNIEENPDNTSSSPIKVDVHIAKHRNGAIGKVNLNFYGTIQKFKEVEG
jgi:replicative DNA helicase